jgi:hypothetical protein
MEGGGGASRLSDCSLIWNATLPVGLGCEGKCVNRLTGRIVVYL